MPMWLLPHGILGCCGVFDRLGFAAEKESRQIDKIPNIFSDACHIAMGSFCGCILSADIRLIKRAKAIYKFKNIPTITKLFPAH